jgi:hypothetical protein
VFELIAGMEVRVVALAGEPHFPEDLQPALAQAAQGASMGFAAGAQGLIIDCCPGGGLPTEVSPQMDGGAQGLITVAPQSDHVDLAALIANGGGAGQTRQGVEIKACAIGADFAQ